VHAVQVADEEPDDDGVVVGGPGGASLEQRNGAGLPLGFLADGGDGDNFLDDHDRARPCSDGR
jgi:hypothetical protein